LVPPESQVTLVITGAVSATMKNRARVSLALTVKVNVLGEAAAE
jgi:hypothetical protein